jgi:hypothetical protein
MDILTFALARLFTKAFWFLVGVTFVGIIMMAARANYRNLIFQAASKTVGKRFN